MSPQLEVGSIFFFCDFLSDIGVGATHQRQRKVLNPAFSASQLRTFSSLFQRLTDKVNDVAFVLESDTSAHISTQAMDRFKELVKERGEIMNVHVWLGRVTLDVIGEST